MARKFRNLFRKKPRRNSSPLGLSAEGVNIRGDYVVEEGRVVLVSTRHEDEILESSKPSASQQATISKPIITHRIYCSLCKEMIDKDHYVEHLKQTHPSTKSPVQVEGQAHLRNATQTKQSSAQLRLARSITAKAILVNYKPKQRKSQLGDIYNLPCPVCNSPTDKYRWARHRSQYHPDVPLNTYDRQRILCGSCNSVVKYEYLLEHIQTEHPNMKVLKFEVVPKGKADRFCQQVQVETKPADIQSKSRKEKWYSNGARRKYTESPYAKATLDESHDEAQDGSKGLGHFRRESSGQFGSYPLHDDYSDESDA